MNQKRGQAEELRNAGLSFREIESKLGIARSTLSYWFHKVKQEPKFIQLQHEKKIIGARKGADRRREQRITTTDHINREAQQEVTTLIHDPLWLAGVMLYWGEGSKEKAWRVTQRLIFTNTDIRMHRLFLAWIKKYFDIKKTDCIYEIYLHDTASEVNAIKKWSAALNVSRRNFRVYWKHTKIKTIRKNNEDSYSGTLRICVRRSTQYTRKVAAWTSSVLELFSL